MSSIMVKAIWSTIRESLVDADDILYELRKELEEELEVLNKKEAGKLRRFLKALKAVEKETDIACEIVCSETGPSVPDWMKKLEVRARKVSRDMKRKGLI